MDMDVARICFSELQLSLNDMGKAQTVTELDDGFERAKEQLEVYYNARKARVVDWQYYSDEDDNETC